MFKNVRWITRALPSVVVGVMLISACTEETVVFRDPFNSPVDSINGFLGYFSVPDARTTCGNCHADKEVDWRETLHADAWAGLHTSEFANDTTCGPCHSVSEKGNVVNVLAGYSVTFDSTYHDVQCESCHGPGIDHVQNPEAVQPLAPAYVDEFTGCGECHQDTHHPFVEQWSESKHAIGSGFGRGSRSGCDECHNGKVALVEQFGVSTEYLEKDDGEVMVHTCVVCHDPHGGPNGGQLRAPIDEGTERNLCIKCHDRRVNPDKTTHGFHAAQGPLVIGDNVGWLPDSLEWPDPQPHYHGDPDVNERLCATCHVEMFTTDDGFHSVGHLFEAAPCVDSDGIPVAGFNCTNDDRRFDACAQCHGSASNGQNKFETYQAELERYLFSIWTDVNGNDTLDVAGPDTGILVRIVQLGDWTILNQDDDVFTTAEGLLFNAQLAHGRDVAPWFGDADYPIADSAAFGGTPGVPIYDHFGTHRSSGGGMHNPTYLREILIAGIYAAASHYGVAAPAGLPAGLPASSGIRKKSQ